MWKFIKQNWLLLLSIIYIISPLDFIPEFLIGPLGLVDDLGLAIILFIRAIYSFTSASKTNKSVTPRD